VRCPRLRDLLEQVFKIVVFDIGLFGFIVDSQQIDGVMDDLDIGDDPGATGLAFAFGGHGQPDLIALIAQRGSLCRFLLEGADERHRKRRRVKKGKVGIIRVG
jgi:hypothetical protein